MLMTRILLTMLLFVVSARAQAQEEDEPGAEAPESAMQDTEQVKPPTLADRIKAVERKDFLKRQRLELYPFFAVDLNDPFYQHMLVGAALSYHLVESLAIEARGGFVLGSIKQSSLRVARTAGLVPNPPEFKYHGDLDFNWAPIYGKISLFGDAILHYDTYLTAGGGVFGTDAGTNPAGNIGIGQRYFINKWLTLRLELRDYIFPDSRDGESDVQNLLVFGLGLSGFLPTSFEYEGI